MCGEVENRVKSKFSSLSLPKASKNESVTLLGITEEFEMTRGETKCCRLSSMVQCRNKCIF
jgi:hypothetical protein